MELYRSEDIRMHSNMEEYLDISTQQFLRRYMLITVRIPIWRTKNLEGRKHDKSIPRRITSPVQELRKDKEQALAC